VYQYRIEVKTPISTHHC